MTLKEIQLKLANEDALSASRGQHLIQHEVSPSAFLLNGLDLEDQQYVFFVRIDSI